jgi:hypothetical protein
VAFRGSAFAHILIGFVSFGVQALGLIGSEGVLPVATYLQRAHEYLGLRAFFAVPTVFWWNSSNAAIQAVWVAGALCSAVCARRHLQTSRVVRRLGAIPVAPERVSGLSLVPMGHPAAGNWISRALPRVLSRVVWLFRWLLFRLMFLSGAVKLLSHDPTWSSLSALSVHYQTQPIPTPLAWFAHQAPAWAQTASVGMVFFIELLIPFCVLGPRRLRRFAAPMADWIATSNHPDRQLCLLQLADTRAVLVPVRR